MAANITVQDVFEAVGQHQAGNLSDEALAVIERVACPSAGACGGQFTANTMAWRVGSHRPGAAQFLGRAGALREPRQLRRGLGRGVMHLLEKGIRARDIRHPQSAGKRRPRRRLHRWLDQRGPAPAGHRA